MSVAEPEPIIPEVIEPDETLPADLVALRKFAYFMDEAVAIPGTSRRVGLDAGLSLIPGVGEIAGGVLSAWIIVGALRHRVPLTRVTRMVLYILLDVSVRSIPSLGTVFDRLSDGAIPVLGTIFDWLFEENVISLKSLLRSRGRSRPPRSAGAVAGAAIVVLAIIVAVALLIIAGLVAAFVWMIHHVVVSKEQQAALPEAPAPADHPAAAAD